MQSSIVALWSIYNKGSRLWDSIVEVAKGRVKKFFQGRGVTSAYCFIIASLWSILLNLRSKYYEIYAGEEIFFQKSS